MIGENKIHNLLDFYNTEIVTGSKIIFYPHFVNNRDVKIYIVIRITDKGSIIAEAITNTYHGLFKRDSWTEIPNSYAANYITLENAMNKCPEYFI